MSTDVVARVPGKALEQMTREIASWAESGSDDFIMDLMDRIAAADSVEGIFEAQDSGLMSGQDFAGRVIVVPNTEAISWRPSSQDKVDQNAYPFYAILKGKEYGGDEITLGCGGKTFVAVLYALIKRNFFDESYVDAVYGPRPADGQALSIRAVPSPNGAYLQLMPFKRPETGSAKSRK